MNTVTTMGEPSVGLGTQAVRQALIKAWEASARRQFECAARTVDPMGKRVMEHGAFVYFNCAQALKAAGLGESSPQTSPTQAEL